MTEQVRCPACYQVLSASSQDAMTPEHLMGAAICWGSGHPGWPASFPVKAPPSALAGPDLQAPESPDLAPPSRQGRLLAGGRVLVQNAPSAFSVMFAKRLAGLACVMALAALLTLPIDYYDYLRLVVMVAALVVAFVGSSVVLYVWQGVDTEHDQRSAERRQWELGFWFGAGVPALLATAVVFNPFAPIYLNSRDAWRPIDIATAVLLGSAAKLVPRPSDDLRPTAGAFGDIGEVSLGTVVVLVGYIFLSGGLR